jgi:NADPH:quinone reductase-like Zn-dependent oxidoreductase
MAMKVVRIHRFGGPDSLEIEDVPMPKPVDDEVVLRVHAAGVDPIEKAGMRLPAPAGREVSGVVELCGVRARTFRRGDEAFALLGPDRGGYADYVVVKATEVAPKPRNLDHIHAAAVPLAGLTAWQGLFGHGRLQAGQRVLIHGGASGIGHLAIQMAKAKGALVATTVAGEDVDFARLLGADRVIDQDRERFEQMGERVNLVFDLVAGQTQERSWGVLARGATLVSPLSEPSQYRALQLGVRALRYTVQPNSAQLAEIGRWIEAGKIRPHVSRVYALELVGEAQRFLESGPVRGKIVLDVAGVASRS